MVWYGIWYVRDFLVRYGMAGFRYGLVCGTVFFVWYWDGVARYDLVSRGCGGLVYRGCGQTDRQMDRQMDRQTDRQTDKSAFIKIDIQFSKLRIKIVLVGTGTVVVIVGY